MLNDTVNGLRPRRSTMLKPGPFRLLIALILDSSEQKPRECHAPLTGTILAAPDSIPSSASANRCSATATWGR